MSKQENHLVAILMVTAAGLMVGGSLWLIGSILGESLWSLTKNESKLSDSQNVDSSNLTVLGDSSGGYATLRSPQFKQALQEVGLNLIYRNESDREKRVELLNKGKADLLVTTLDCFLKEEPRGKIIGLIDRTLGADAIVLNTKKYPTLKSLSDLERVVRQTKSQAERLGISFAKNTTSEYLLSLVLSAKHDAFKVSDFQIESVADASQAWHLLNDPDKNLAMAVIPEPYVTEAKKRGYAIALSSKDAPKAIIDVIVASDRYIASKPYKIAKFLETYYHQLEVSLRSPYSFQEQMAKDSNLSADRAVAVLQTIDFFTSLESKNWMVDGTLKERITSTAAVLVLSGKMKNIPLNIEELYSSKFIETAANNTEALIEIVRQDNPELARKLAGQETTIVVKDRLELDRAIETHEPLRFQTGSAVLTSESHEALDKLAEKLQEFNEQTVAVRVFGHTSKHDFELDIKNLSHERASVVVAALRQRGIEHQVIAEGKSFHLPLSGIPLEDPRHQRTEIHLVNIR